MKHKITVKRVAAVLMALALTGSLALAAAQNSPPSGTEEMVLMEPDDEMALALAAPSAAPIMADVPDDAEDMAVAPVAPGSTDERMARVTALVKDKLALDTEEYTDFQGGVSEQELGIVWDLYWNGEGKSLNVEALEDGTVVAYWYNDNQDYYAYSSYLSVFPKTDTEQAKIAARAFLDKVIDPATESIELTDPSGRNYLGRTSTTFHGQILLNGLDSPLTYSITVRGSDNMVTSFRRDAPSMKFLGNIPAAVPAVSQDTASATLRTTLNLELIYVTSEDDSTRAVLRYVPKNQETLYVDAQTGALVKPGEMTYITNAPAMAEEAAMDMAMGSSAKSRLTEVELSGVEKMSGVLPKEELDRLIRAESAYQLDEFTLSTARYRLVKDENDVESVQCSIAYSVPEEDAAMDTSLTKSTGFYKRNFTVNARTGEVLSLYSYGGNWNDERIPDVHTDRALEIAQSFLARFTKYADTMPLYDTSDETAKGAPSYNFTFTRKVNGYFYPENAATVTIDCMSGAVTGVTFNYNEDITFDSTQNIIPMDKAVDAWLNTYDVTLAYRLLGKELNAADGALEARLIDIGMTQFYSLFLSYGLERDTYCPGIDAKSAEPVAQTPDNGEISYDDVSGHTAESAINLLASYNIGYSGGTFEPDKTLTQWDAVCLLASTQGYRVNPADTDKDTRDNLYAAAYRMNALTRDQRKDDAVMTNGALVKLFINSAGYASIAQLNGIFTCQYLDRASIPAGDMGYAALAQGFGMVQNVYGAERSVTRADAAVMLCRLMERPL